MSLAEAVTIFIAINLYRVYGKCFMEKSLQKLCRSLHYF